MSDIKEQLLQKFADLPEMVLSCAYIYALNYTQYGVDVTKEWITAVQQNAALGRAYERGYHDGMETAHKAIAEFNTSIGIGTLDDKENTWRESDK